VQADPAFLGAIAGILSEVCVPLHDQGRVVGILNVESTNEVMLTHADLNLMLAVSSHVTIALGRARIYQEMRERQEHFATIFRASPVTISITERLTGRFLDVNDRFLALMGYARAEVIDRTALELNAWADPADRARVGQALLKDRSIHGMEITFRTKSGSMLDTLASFELITLNGVECILSLTQDITQRKRAEADRDRLIAELTSALANIKVLRGLVPICASCKKIRDDDGFWNQFESYIQAHTEAQFSHGICPDCVRRLYPDFSDDET
jgi:PAS domain S-box-containing protein